MTWLGSSWTRWAVLVWVALFALGCSGGSRKDELELELEGRTFLLQSTRGDTPVTGTNISIEFREHELRFGACNLFTADFSLCDGRVCIMGYSKTEIGCDAERSEQDAWLASFFTSEPSLRLQGDELTLEGLGVTLRFLDREVADPDRPLTGRVWSIDAFVEGGGVRSFGSGFATVTFGGDGTWGAFTSCNDGQGAFETSTGTLGLSDTIYTDDACNDTISQYVDHQIRAVLTDGEVDYEIEANELRLERGDLGLMAYTD